MPLENYRIGLPKKGKFTQIFNSDDTAFFGTGDFNNEKLTSQAKLWHSRKNSTEITIPPLGMVVFKY